MFGAAFRLRIDLIEHRCESTLALLIRSMNRSDGYALNIRQSRVLQKRLSALLRRESR